MDALRKQWEEALGTAAHFPHKIIKQKTYSDSDFDGEMFLQQNGMDSFQRLFMAFPKHADFPVPAVAVPFYFPEAMLGRYLETGEALPFYTGIEMLLHLVKRGYAVASADAYHLTIAKSEKSRDDFTRWADAAQALRQKHPQWTGMGKLLCDTRLLVDALAADPRVDASRIGIAGHSLGGKMAFYAGCLDDRIKAVLCSDFGIGWDSTNWADSWYWGEKLPVLKARGMDHADLLRIARGKPFCLLAGQYDSLESLDLIQKSGMYSKNSNRLLFINHATGHRPPWDALQKGYDFLDQWI